MRLKFRDFSIKIKIILLILSVNTVSLVLSALLFFQYDSSEFKHKERNKLTVLAQGIGNFNTGTILYNDTVSATEYLNSFKAEKQIRQAAIFNIHGNLFASYTKDKLLFQQLPQEFLLKDTFYINDNELILLKPIKLYDEVIGCIYINSNLEGYNTRVNQFISIIFVIIFLSSIIAFLLAVRLQRIISVPIQTLAFAMHQVSQTKDFSVRVIKHSNDEIGELSEGFNTMLTQIEKQNQAVNLAKEHAEHSLKVKEQFLANMSHEIRTPMNVIFGMSNLLLETELDSDQQIYLESIKVSADNLLVIINDILDFSKIEAGKIEFESIEFDLHHFMERFKKTVHFSATKKGLSLRINIADTVPQIVIGDKVRLSQIILNLTGNAIKFTHQGGVVINISSIEKHDDTVRLQFSVIDTGIGIPSDKIDSIFTSFNQVSSSTTRKYGGTGLGLTISKQLVELQGGAISVVSEFGQGSIFTFNLPFKIGKRRAKNSIETKNSNPVAAVQKRKPEDIFILLVEDNKMNQLFATKVLQMNKYNVEIAENGKIALEMLKQKKFDIVLMDLHMPEMDGYEATKIIRESFPDDKRRIPIIALTAAATKGEVNRCFSIGITDFIAKPFKPNELIDKIIEMLNEN